jgi:signal transduction histidine kinase
VLAGPQGDQPTGLPDQASLAIARSGGVDLRDTTIEYQNLPVRILSQQALPDGTVVQVIQDRTPEVRFLGSLAMTLAIGGLVALFLALLAGYAYSGRAMSAVRRSLELQRLALQRQQEFAANASHELRTPLAVIATSVTDLERNGHQRVEAVGEALSDIKDGVRDLTALVEDMLLLARTDSGVVQVQSLPVDLSDVALEASSMLTALGREHEVGVVLDPLPTSLQGDPQRLRQLVTILVDNAIHHSPPGSTVDIIVRPDKGEAVLEVSDRGPGIRPEDMPRLWQRFWRADNAPPGGSGLGLAIAKWIVDQHRGTIEALSREGGGATFLVRFPAD